MIFNIRRQESYSRGELLLRAFFGFIYIYFPHAFLLIFAGIWGTIQSFIAFWVILFTGRYPQSFFEYHVGLMKWNLRVSARMNNMLDGYPSFGINGSDDNITLEVDYPENLNRGTLILKFFFGWLYVALPHGFCLFFRSIVGLFLSFLSFWVILFSGNYPEGWFDFGVGTMRWNLRVNLYLLYMTDDYPPFSGLEYEDETSQNDPINDPNLNNTNEQ